METINITNAMLFILLIEETRHIKINIFCSVAITKMVNKADLHSHSANPNSIINH